MQLVWLQMMCLQCITNIANEISTCRCHPGVYIHNGLTLTFKYATRSRRHYHCSIKRKRKKTHTHKNPKTQRKWFDSVSSCLLYNCYFHWYWRQLWDRLGIDFWYSLGWHNHPPTPSLESTLYRNSQREIGMAIQTIGYINCTQFFLLLVDLL